MKIPIGISSCVIGNKVRFDSGHKRNHFIAEQMEQYLEFIPVCPEMAIGLGTPRPTIRLIDVEGQQRLVDSKNSAVDHTDEMQNFAASSVSELAKQELRGYVVCKGSPTCGMERVKIYDAKSGYASKNAVGMYTKHLMEKMPWLPVEEDGRLNDLILRENFVTRVYTLDDYYKTVKQPYSRQQFVDFHSRHKLLFLSHNQAGYRELGKLIANIHEYELDEFFILYRQQIMTLMKKPASKRNHSNVLQHVQGYFKKMLDKNEKQELAGVIDQYRRNELPLMAPVTLIKHYLNKYPNDYLQHQTYFDPHPQNLKLRVTL